MQRARVQEIDFAGIVAIGVIAQIAFDEAGDWQFRWR
jgi:hypothetical protein